MSLPYAEVIGDPVAQSKSPAIHRFWLERLGLDAEYRAVQIGSDQLQDYFASRVEDPSWCGCNVTMPLKQALQPYLSSVEEPARTIGAVNTVYRAPDGQLAGQNTDAAGFLEPLQPLLARSHYFRMARVLGTGGAARAIVHALAQHGFTIVLAGRDPGKARSLLDELAPRGEHFAIELAHFAERTDFAFDDREGCCDLVVNASPLGMHGWPPLHLDLSHVPPGSIIYDIVTDPVRTPLLQSAETAGFRTVDGLAMLLGQAAIAFELFFGYQPPREHDAELRALLAA